MTTAGSTLGTLASMAPERFNAGTSDPRSDIYALACVLFECLTGSRPFPAGSLEQQIAGHMVSEPPRQSATDSTLSALDDVIAKGMAKNRRNAFRRRPNSAPPRGAHCMRPCARPVDPDGIRPVAQRHPAVGTCRVGQFVTAAVVVVVVAAGGAIGAWQLLGAPDTRQASVNGSTSPPDPQLAPGGVASIAVSVPADIRATGRLVIGVNVPYAPGSRRSFRRCGRRTSTSGCRRSPTPRSVSRPSTSSPT